MPSSRTPLRQFGEDRARPGGPRIQDVAERAGVAIGTVSNVLNNPGVVTEQTRLKVEAAIAELGFVRNSAARALAARRTDTVGLILIDIGNSLFVDIARGAGVGGRASPAQAPSRQQRQHSKQAGQLSRALRPSPSRRGLAYSARRASRRGARRPWPRAPRRSRHRNVG
jgi:Bacterial regulatory proteins, lacI family